MQLDHGDRTIGAWPVGTRGCSFGGAGSGGSAFDVRADELRAHSSTRRPSVQLGDRAVLYAAGWQVVFALADVVSAPENDPGRTRWSWRFAIRPTLALSDLREAPPVEAAGVPPAQPRAPQRTSA